MSEDGPNPTVVLPQSAGAIGEISVREWEPSDVDGLVHALSVSHAHLQPWMPWVDQQPRSRCRR